MIPTAVPIINVALSGKLDGGLTPGLTMWAGPSKHFKTAFSLLMAKSYLDKYPDAALLFYDSEFGTPQSYFDSFGIGSDDDQKRLLGRINSWLKPGGKVIIEIGSTWFWARAAGKEIDLGGAMRSYDFDCNGSRLIDKWWLPENPDEVYFQSLRCYTPADLEMLLSDSKLKLLEIMPAGTIDFEIMEFVEQADLENAMTYFVLLEKH
jgi:hypothetical protein